MNRCSCLRRNRQPDHKYHNRDGYWLSNFAKFATSNCGSCDNYRSRHVRRAEELIPAQPGIASQDREALGRTILEPLSLFGVQSNG